MNVLYRVESSTNQFVMIKSYNLSTLYFSKEESKYIKKTYIMNIWENMPNVFA